MKRFLLISLLYFGLCGCSKVNSDQFYLYSNNPINDTTWTQELSASTPAYKLETVLSIAPAIDSFSPASTSILHFNNNLDITVPAGSITYKNGSPVTGKVRMEVSHLSSNGDFIRFARPTTSYGKLLECGGALNINVFKEDQELALKPGKQIILTVPATNPVNTMKAFVGLHNPQQPLPVGTNPFFTWIPANDSSRISTFTRQDSSGTVKGYTIFSRNLHWFNFQYYVDSSAPKTMLSVTCPSNFTNRNTSVFAVFRQHKRVVQLIGDYNARAFIAPNLSIGSGITLVSLSMIGEQMYLGVKDFTVNNIPITNVNPVPYPKQEIDDFLKNL